MASSKKRTYLDSYLNVGFTSINERGDVKPQCVICYKVLAAEAMKPSKLKSHLDADGSINQQNAEGMQAFLVALEREKKPHTIREQLIVPCAKIMVKLVSGIRVQKNFA